MAHMRCLACCTLSMIFLALLSACDGSVPSDTTITDPSGSDRLVLRDRVSKSISDDKTYSSFDRLIWEKWDGSTWAEHAVFTRRQVAALSSQDIWLEDLVSFDPVRGTAIVVVAEEDPSIQGDPSYIARSWREFDLVTRNQLQPDRLDDVNRQFVETVHSSWPLVDQPNNVAVPTNPNRPNLVGAWRDPHSQVAMHFIQDESGQVDLVVPSSHHWITVVNNLEWREDGLVYDQYSYHPTTHPFSGARVTYRLARSDNPDELIMTTINHAAGETDFDPNDTYVLYRD